MPIQNYTAEQLRAAISELDRALFNHEQWFDSLLAVLICRVNPDERDLDEAAHRRCRFGQWYYSSAGTHSALANQPGFAELGVEHEHMHFYAAKMLRAQGAGEPISFDDYQRFISALKRMRMEIASLKQDLEDTLYKLDPLTGVPGRMGVLGKLRELRSLVRPNVQSCTLAMMDIDDFKQVNDRGGHVAGDKVLVSMVQYVTNRLRATDKIYRYGGEEFLIILPGTTLKEGLEIIERLREGLASLPHTLETGESIHVTASFGLTEITSASPVEEDIARADSALYLAKISGRNRTVAWEPSMGTEAPPQTQSSAA